MPDINTAELDYLQFAEAAAPSTPASGLVRIYAKTDGSLYSKDDAGAETALGGGGGSGALVFLASQVASSSAQLDFTGIFSGYDVYQIVGNLIAPATDAVDLRVEIGTGGGPTYDTGNNYQWALAGWHAGGFTANDAGTTGIARVFVWLSNAAEYGHGSFCLTCHGFGSTTRRKQIFGSVQYVGQSGPLDIVGNWNMSWKTAGTAVSALRFIMSSGNIASGVIRVYGVSNS